MVAEWRSVGPGRRRHRNVSSPSSPSPTTRTPTSSNRTARYIESFDRHAFDGIQTRTNRIPVNRDHDPARLVGKVAAFHPNDRAGLVAELRMTPGVPLADETLAFARDDVLGASISFGVKPDGVVWSDRGRRRRIVKAIAWNTSP